MYWSLDNGTMMLANGDYFPIVEWFDSEGTITEDEDEVYGVIAGPDKRGKHWQTHWDMCRMESIH